MKETILPNGLKVLTKEVHSSPIVTTYVWYRVGARNEKVGITGISHMVEHLMFKGTKYFKQGEIDRLITRTGGQSNAFTCYDHTAYFITLPRDQLDLALSIEADRMTHSRMSPKDLATEKQVILSELEGEENDPQQTLDQMVGEISFLVHPYRFPVIGFKSDIHALTPQAVKQYYRRYYIPNNAILAIVGDFQADEVLSRVEKLFGSIPRGNIPPIVVTVEPSQRGERRTVIRQEGSIVYVQVQFHIPPFDHPDSYPLAVMDMALVDGCSSWLYRALVESQLAVSVDSQISQSLDPGWYSLYFTVRNGVEPARLEEVLLAEIEKIREKLLTPQELQKAVNQTYAHFIYANDVVTSQAFNLGYFETIGSYKLLGSYVERIRKVTAEDVRRVATRYLTADNLTVGYLQPFPEPGDQSGNNDMLKTRSNKKSLIADYSSLLSPPAPASFPSGTLQRRRHLTSSQLSGNNICSFTPHTSRVVLSNGLVVLTQENHANPTVAITGILKAGGMYDPKDKRGLANFTAGLLDRGTMDHTFQEIAEQIDFIGASLNLEATTETISFSTYCLSDNFEQTLNLVGNILLHPTFPQKEIEKLRGEILTTLKEEEENPESRSQLEFYSLLYPWEHPYHQDSLRAEEGIRQVSQADILSFYGQYYRPDSTILVVVGNVSTAEIQEKVSRIFGTWTAHGKKLPFSIPNIPLPEKPQTYVVNMENKAEVIVRLGHTGIARGNPDYYACLVMNHILGGGTFGGRLTNRLREEKGLTYSVFSYFQTGLGAGPWMTYLQVNPKDVKEAIIEIKENMEDIREKGVTFQELKDNQDNLVGSLYLSLESNQDIAGMLCREELYGLGLDHVELYPFHIRGVKREQVREAAQEYLHPDRLVTVIVGPYS